jgi:hypothetical protein
MVCILSVVSRFVCYRWCNGLYTIGGVMVCILSVV